MSKAEQSYCYWQDFYKKYFGIKTDLSVLIPPKPQGDFTWPIVTIEQVNEQMLYDRCKELFPCWRRPGKSLNQVLNPDATSKGIHIAFFRDRVEADEELKNLSAKDLEEKGIQGIITLKQRLVMELDYFGCTEKHLDIKNATLCAGSRDSDRDTPDVCWWDNRMKVDWSLLTYHFDTLCARQAVSFV